MRRCGRQWLRDEVCRGLRRKAAHTLQQYLFVQGPEQTISPSHQCELDEKKKEKCKMSTLSLCFSKTEVIGTSWTLGHIGQ